MNVPITRYEVIEINIPTGTTLTQFNFPDMPNLRNAKILAVEYISGILVTKSPNTLSEPLSFNNAASCFVNLYQGDLQRIKNLPLVFLNPYTINDTTGANNVTHAYNQTRFNGIIVSWTKCFIKFSQAPDGGTVVSFGVTYVQPEDEGYTYLGQNL